MVKKYNSNDFFNELAPYQMLECIKQCDSDMNTEVIPALEDDDEFIHYEHFLRIPGYKGSRDLYVCVDASYLRRGPENVTRKIRGVRVYDSRSEMELFMAASDYSNDWHFMPEETRFIFN